MPLRTTRHIERALDLKETSLVIKTADLARIDEPACGFVCNDRPVVPAVPKPFDDIDEFIGPFIAQFMRQMLVAIEVQRRPGIGACHHVPRRPSAADMIDGAKDARDVEWFGKAG